MNPLTTAVVVLLTKTVFPIIAAVVAGFIAVLINKLSARFHLGNMASMDTLLSQLAMSGVQSAEEHAIAAIKNSGIKITSSGKLDIAVAHILTAVPTITRETAQRYVHSAIAKIPGIGATGDRVIK